MSGPRLLVVEGNTAEGRARHVAAGGRAASDGYAELLRQLAPTARVDICFPADLGANLPDRMGLQGYDGIAITGSSLNIYNLGPSIMRQVELARAVFETDTHEHFHLTALTPEGKLTVMLVPVLTTPVPLKV